MIKLLAVSLLLCLAVSVFAALFPCRDELDCRRDECCVQDFAGRGPHGKVCRELGDDHGDLCGGDYFCPTCERGLKCVEVELAANVVDAELPGCSRPANGTCQREPRVLDRTPVDRVPVDRTPADLNSTADAVRPAV